MRFINRVPIAVWFIVAQALCYGAWNPTGMSLWHLWFASDMPWSIRVLSGGLFTAIVIMFLTETWRSLGWIGLTLYVVIVVATLAVLRDLGLFEWSSLGSVQWWGQAVLATLLTLGFQGGRIYRVMTGRVPVSSPHDVSAVPHHHN